MIKKTGIRENPHCGMLVNNGLDLYQEAFPSSFSHSPVITAVINVMQKDPEAGVPSKAPCRKGRQAWLIPPIQCPALGCSSTIGPFTGKECQFPSPQ